MVCTGLVYILYTYCANVQIFLVELVQPLIMTGNAPPLVFVSGWAVIYTDLDYEKLSGMFEDAAEEETFQRQCMFDSHFNKIGHHLIFASQWI